MQSPAPPRRTWVTLKAPSAPASQTPRSTPTTRFDETTRGPTSPRDLDGATIALAGPGPALDGTDKIETATHRPQARAAWTTDIEVRGLAHG